MSSSDKSRKAVSYLVRLWVEDREADEPSREGEPDATAEAALKARRKRGASSAVERVVERGIERGEGEREVVRGFVRNLQTGQESYVSDPERLARNLMHGLDADSGEGAAGGDELEDGRDDGIVIA